MFRCSRTIYGRRSVTRSNQCGVNVVRRDWAVSNRVTDPRQVRSMAERGAPWGSFKEQRCVHLRTLHEPLLHLTTIPESPAGWQASVIYRRLIWLLRSFTVLITIDYRVICVINTHTHTHCSVITEKFLQQIFSNWSWKLIWCWGNIGHVSLINESNCVETIVFFNIAVCLFMFWAFSTLHCD